MILRPLISGLAAGTVFLLLTDHRVYDSSLISPFFSVTLLSATIIHLVVQRSMMDFFALAISSVVFSIVDFHFLGYRPLIWANLSFIGISSLLVLAIRATWAPPERRRMLLSAFFPALLFIVSDRLAPVFLGWTGDFHPKTLDLYLLVFDGSLGTQLSFVVGKWFRHWPWFGSLSWIFYLALPLPLALVYGCQLLRHSKLAFRVMMGFIVTGPIGVAFYNVFPATGPIHVFGNYFPSLPPTASETAHLFLQPIPVLGYRNGIPSLHMAWVLLAWWNARELSWVTKTIVFLFVVFTFLSTLGTGEHYFVDLVVALPFALMVQASATVPYRNGILVKVLPILAGGAGTLLWLGVLRYTPQFALISPVIPWSLTVLTVLLTMGAERKYCRESIFWTRGTLGPEELLSCGKP